MSYNLWCLYSHSLLESKSVQLIITVNFRTLLACWGSFKFLIFMSRFFILQRLLSLQIWKPRQVCSTSFFKVFKEWLTFMSTFQGEFCGGYIRLEAPGQDLLINLSIQNRFLERSGVVVSPRQLRLRGSRPWFLRIPGSVSFIFWLPIFPFL